MIMMAAAAGRSGAESQYDRANGDSSVPVTVGRPVGPWHFRGRKPDSVANVTATQAGRSPRHGHRDGSSSPIPLSNQADSDPGRPGPA